MKVVHLGEGEKYVAAKHFSSWSMHKFEMGKDTQKTTLSVTHFLPDGGAEMSASANKERIYCVLSGNIKITGKNEEHSLKAGDMIYIGPDEERSIEVIGLKPAEMFAIVVNLS